MKNYKKTKIACYLGFVTQAIAANFAPLMFLKFHNDYNISLGNIALISTFFFFTQLLVDLFCAKYVDRIGYRVSIVASEICSAVGLLGLAFKKPGESARISGGCRVWVFTVCAGCMAAAMLSMLIAWTPLSSRVISGVQGRYFLPFLPVLLMALKNDIVILTKDKNRSILYLMCCLNGYVLLRLFSVVSMRI